MSSDIRVAHYTRRWLPQTQTWLYNQVRFLPDSVTSHVICEVTENLDRFAVPRLHSMADSSTWRYVRDVSLRLSRMRRHYPFISEVASACNVDILHTHFGHTSWRQLPAVRKAGVKHVATFYGNDATGYPHRDEPWRGRFHTLFDEADAILCEGPHMARTIAELGCPEDRLHVHRLGVPVDMIPYRPRSYRSGQPLRVLIAASFREKKGIPYAIEAVGRLKRRVPVEITIFGGVDTVPLLGGIRKSVSGAVEEKCKIEDAVERWDLGEHVRWMGYQPHDVLMKEAYRNHVYMQPSVTARDGDGEGGAPLTLVEMAASGMPIVSTRHCDIPHVIQHEVSGLLAPERDPKILFEHLSNLVHRPERWAKLVRAARDRVEAEYDAVKQGRRLGRIYERLLAR